MRTWSMIGVVAVVGFVAAMPRDAAAKGVKQPAELIATISLGDARTLDGVRAFADAIQPGMSAMLTDEMVRHQLAAIVEAKALDGLDLFAPRYVLVVDGGSDARGLVLVGKVSDPKAFARGAGTAQTTVSRGWGAIGPKAAVRSVAKYALATLPSQPAVAAPTAVVYVTRVVDRYRDELQAFRAQTIAGMSGSQSTPQLSSIITTYIDGLYGLLSDGDRIVVTLDVGQNLGGLDVAVVPKRGSRLAAFIAAQRASDYALLDKLPAGATPMVMAGRIDAGPYRAGLLDAMAAMYGAAGKDMLEAIAAIMAASTGDLAIAMRMGGGKPMSMTQVFGVADKRAADAAIDRLLGILKAGRTVNMVGLATTFKTTGNLVHDGVVLKGYETTYDYSKLSVAQRAQLDTMSPGGKHVSRIATFDALGLMAVGGDPAAVIDAARGKRDHFTLGADATAYLASSRARKESFFAAIDFGAIVPTTSRGPGRWVMLSAGFADKAAHLRFAISAATVRTFAGQP